MLASLVSRADVRLEMEQPRRGRRVLALAEANTMASRNGELKDKSHCNKSGASFASVSISLLPWSKKHPPSNPMMSGTSIKKPCYKNPRDNDIRPISFRVARMKWSNTCLDEPESAVVRTTARTSLFGEQSQVVQRQQAEPTPTKQFMHKEVAAAAFAGCVLSCLTFPLSSIKTQLMAGVPFGKIMNQIRSSGVRRSYQGLSA